MIKAALLQRFKVLSEVLNKSRGLGYLSSGQRTAIHMERSAILQSIDKLEGRAKRAKETPSYQVSRKIENIIDRVRSDFKI